MTWFIHFLASPAVEILVVLKHVPAIKVFVCVDQGLGDFAINTTKQKPFQSKQFKLILTRPLNGENLLLFAQLRHAEVVFKLGFVSPLRTSRILGQKAGDRMLQQINVLFKWRHALLMSRCATCGDAREAIFTSWHSQCSGSYPAGISLSSLGPVNNFNYKGHQARHTAVIDLKLHRTFIQVDCKSKTKSCESMNHESRVL